MRDEINQLLSIKVIVYLPFSLQKIKSANRTKYGIHWNLLPAFWHWRFPFWGKMKPLTPVLSLLGNLFTNKLFRLAITFAREVCHLMMEKNMTIVLFFSLSLITALVGEKQDLSWANLPVPHPDRCPLWYSKLGKTYCWYRTLPRVLDYRSVLVLSLQPPTSTYTPTPTPPKQEFQNAFPGFLGDNWWIAFFCFFSDKGPIRFW